MNDFLHESNFSLSVIHTEYPSMEDTHLENIQNVLSYVTSGHQPKGGPESGGLAQR